MNRRQDIYFFLSYSICSVITSYKNMPCESQQTGKFLKKWEYQIILSALWEICMQVKKQQLKLDMERQTGSKLGKQYIKVLYCHLAYLTDMQS